MALSITELELQSTEYLPAREVMTSFGYRSDGQDIEPDSGHVVDGSDGNEYEGGVANNLNIQDVLTDINVENVQVGLLNVMLHSVQDTIDIGTANDDNNALVSG